MTNGEVVPEDDNCIFDEKVRLVETEDTFHYAGKSGNIKDIVVYLSI